MELIRSSISIDCGLPCVTVRSAPAIVFSRPAQRSLTLRPARSPSRQATLYTESSDSFVASAAASIATGWSEPVPGRELHPLKSTRLFTAHFFANYIQDGPTVVSAFRTTGLGGSRKPPKDGFLLTCSVLVGLSKRLCDRRGLLSPLRPNTAI